MTQWPRRERSTARAPGGREKERKVGDERSAQKRGLRERAVYLRARCEVSMRYG